MAFNADEFQCRFVSELLLAESSDLAAAAARQLLEQCPDIAHRYRPQPALKWRPALECRIHELAAAIAAQRPEVFTGQVGWAKFAFCARQVPVEDLSESLRVLDEVVVPRMPPEDRALVRGYLLIAMRDIENAPSRPTEVLTAASGPHAGIIAEYLVALLEGERMRACRVIGDAAAAGLSVRDIYTDVLTPALREIGRMWLLGDVTVAEEHFATATTLTAMSQLLLGAPGRERNGRTMIAATVEGNTHEVGVRMVADLFELEGWRSIYLGASVPAVDLRSAVIDFGAELVALSAAIPTQLQTLADTISVLRHSDHHTPPKIIVGGCGLTGISDVWERLGADGYASDPEHALRVGSALVGIT